MKPLDKNRVLIIDGERDILEIVQQGLSGVYSCHTASSVYEGLQLIKKQKFDILLLDVLLRGISSSKALTSLQHNENSPPVKILLSSSTTNPPRGEIQYDSIIEKPFSIYEVCRSIEKCLSAKKYVERLGNQALY